MNRINDKYARFAIVEEMLGTSDVVRNFPVARLSDYPAPSERVILTGEGSSRIMPARHVTHHARRRRYRQEIFTESATEARVYDLSDTDVFVASNSGKTAECVHLIRSLRDSGSRGTLFGVTAGPESPVATECDHAYVLSCGDETAVAATKSVVEQALFYDVYFRLHNERPLPDLARLADAIEGVLTTELPADMIERIARAQTVYFAGHNDGVAEELALKANEIVRARSGFLEGTYAVHGIEEVMQPEDVLIWIDPIEEYEQKFADVLEKGVGMAVFAVSARETRFQTVRVPEEPDFRAYLELAAGWNVLVETGILLGRDIDKPQRARKVGNEYTGG